ncbi:MAG: response regulator [Hydrogenophaga sp.]
MSLIVVAEDDPGTLRLLCVVLEKKGHDVLGVADGQTAWERIAELRPDVVVSDIHMPGLSGLQLLERVRTHPHLGLTPFIFLTSLQERRDMRQAMSLGADDYIVKPFRARELAEAVLAQVNKNQMRAASQDLKVQASLDQALKTQANELSDAYELRLAQALNEQWPGASQAREAGFHAQATVLCASVLAFERLATRLEATALAQLMKRFYDNCGDTVFLFGAHSLQFQGDGVVAVFADGPDAAPSAPQGLRAAKAALALRKASANLMPLLQELAPGQTEPGIDIGVSLHSGPVAMMRLGGLLGGAAQAVPMGETVLDALAMHKQAGAPSRSGVTVSAQMLRSITGAVQPVRRYLMNLPHRADPLDVCLVEPLPA